MPPYCVAVSPASYECPHAPGTWSITAGALNKALDGGGLFEVAFGTMAMTPVGVCPATPNTHGVPPCVHTAIIIATSTKKLHGFIPAVLASDVQISLSNGLPSSVMSAAESVDVEGS